MNTYRGIPTPTVNDGFQNFGGALPEQVFKYTPTSRPGPTIDVRQGVVLGRPRLWGPPFERNPHVV